MAPSEGTAEATAQEEAAATGVFLPDLILGIEDPELSPHPNRQRHLARVLMDLAYGSIPGVGRRTQVIYCTHSPLLVDLRRFHQIRVVRKQPGEARRTTVGQVGLETLRSCREEPLKDRKRRISPPWGEMVKGNATNPERAGLWWTWEQSVSVIRINQEAKAWRTFPPGTRSPSQVGCHGMRQLARWVNEGALAFRTRGHLRGRCGPGDYRCPS